MCTLQACRIMLNNYIKPPLSASGDIGYFCPEKDMYYLKRENNALREDAVTFSCLGKLGPADASGFKRWKGWIEQLFQQALEFRTISSSPLIIGLAESGIIPSALFHQILREKNYQAGWICSTRRPASGIYFSESHSHGPDHIIPLPKCRPSELCFVEDEITTGRTLLNLSLRLCSHLNLSKVRFFAFADTRTQAHKDQFQSILNAHGMTFSTHTLIQPKRSANGDKDRNGELKTNILHDNHAVVSKAYKESDWHFPWQRPALKKQSNIQISFPRNLKGSILAVGEAVDMGLQLVQANPGLKLHHITLSPWKIDGRHIINRLDICGKYYLYNYHSLASPIYILNDPIDNETGAEALEILRQKGFDAEFLTL